MQIATRVLSLCLVAVSYSIHSQVITIKPYLQDASPNSISILWETDSVVESIVEWGLTASLGNIATGTADISSGTNLIHDVKVEGLDRFTKYYYRVRTGSTSSSIYSFKTPPFASDHHPFRMIAMSDMQQDGAFPGKFSEVVHDGILDFLAKENGGEVIDNLALVIIPGDLVQDGNNFDSWRSTFFKPSEDLFSQVPVYPVPGNHENNSMYFFKYFKLPNNGTPGFEEHWWFKDYGNVRILGLDSNGPYTNQSQLDWLENVLAETEDADSLDFVFAQLHHPFKSELWTPGELDYTGEVIKLLENFTTKTGKPSIHFFGHTHAYSRGNSRDHKHLWINVATAGGAIDNWGEFPNNDYDEFSISEDEYGFVSVEVTDDAHPKITIKRISRGDQDLIRDNPVTDSMTIRLNPSIVNPPGTIFPFNVEVLPECVVLKANNFNSPNPASIHGQSHWQVSKQNDFQSIQAESWKNFENWYFEVNTQDGDDLSDEKILGLEEEQQYYWRVRYRDRELNWSQWSAASPFTTGKSNASANLLLNPGAEDSLMHWTIAEGIVESLPAEICDGTSPHSGEKYFIAGGLCESSEVGRCYQDIDMNQYIDSIQNGNYLVSFGGYLSDYANSDIPEIKLTFLDQNNDSISQSNVLSALTVNWTLVSETMLIPINTAFIRFEMKGTRVSGTDNDSYFDDLFLKVGTANTDCSVISKVINEAVYIPELKVAPNPIFGNANIYLPDNGNRSLILYLTDVEGNKHNCPIQYSKNQIQIQKGNLAAGTYFFWVRDQGKIVGKGKIVFL